MRPLAACLLLLTACGGRGSPADGGVDDLGAASDLGGPRDAGVPGDGGPPVCSGTQPACALLATPERCATVDGCGWSQCVGFPLSCATQLSDGDCRSISGCVWSGTTCGGTALACPHFAAMGACSAQPGCVWGRAASCRGAAVACETYDTATCTTHEGCRPYTAPMDGGIPDAGPPPMCMPDAGSDAGAPDAGSADAGTADAGSADAGSTTCVPPAGPSPYPGCNPTMGLECDGDWTGTNPRTGAAYCAPACGADQCCSPRDGRFQCVAKHADGTCPAADVFVDGRHIRGMVTIETNTYGTTSCEVAEGCVGSPGNRRVLRFDTWTPNVGEADLYLGQVPAGGVSDSTFSWSSCHMHHHFNTYAAYELITSDGCCVAATGHKQAFCLIDLQRYDTSIGSDTPTYDCGFQGIQRGYQDVYSSGLDCQWIDITDVAPGDYWLRIRVNVEHILNEADYGNDETWVPVHVP